MLFFQKAAVSSSITQVLEMRAFSDPQHSYLCPLGICYLSTLDELLCPCLCGIRRYYSPVLMSRTLQGGHVANDQIWGLSQG